MAVLDTTAFPGTLDAEGVYQPLHKIRFVTAASLFDEIGRAHV